MDLQCHLCLYARVYIPYCCYLLSFLLTSCRNLVNNLGKGLYKGKSFSLRSCLRIRAAARVHRTGPEGVARVTTPLRIEVVTPNMSFEAVQVGALPIFTSRLLEDQAKSNMGYITLNQTRQLVLLPSSSERASVNCEVITAPVVGVWVSMPGMVAPLDFSAGQDSASACCRLCEVSAHGTHPRQSVGRAIDIFIGK